jgi:hypothetical protein
LKKEKKFKKLEGLEPMTKKIEDPNHPLSKISGWVGVKAVL